jgi:uncharacterized membrane protein YeaQ/YmgE (transglycosylase-associated protein family)
MLWTLIGMLFTGLVAGFIARAIVPGRDSLSLGMTVLLGVVGSFVGGFILRALNVIFTGAKWSTTTGGDLTAGIFGSIFGAVVALIFYRMYVANNDDPLNTNRRR